MAESTVSKASITLKYPDKDTFTFSKLVRSANNDELYAIAKVLNAFQDGAMSSVVKSVTYSII